MGKTIERLVSLLESVATAGRPVSVSDVQRTTDLPKATCYRMMHRLSTNGLLDHPDEDGKYVIGERLQRIALRGKSDVDVRQRAAPLLKAAAAKYNETVFLARFRNSKIEITHIETPNDHSRAYIYPGLGERPLHACSCAKAIAAFAPLAFQESILSGSLKRYTEHTKTDKAALRAEFAQIAERGFADCDQEIDMGIASVAAPILVGSAGVLFSVGAVGPIRRFEKTYREKVGHNLKGLAAQISGAIQLSNIA